VLKATDSSAPNSLDNDFSRLQFETSEMTYIQVMAIIPAFKWFFVLLAGEYIYVCSGVLRVLEVYNARGSSIFEFYFQS